MGTSGKYICRGEENMMISTAQAKINITLEVLKKRGDGYHEIRSIVQTIDFCDKLQFQTGPRIEFKCNMPEWSASKSLVSKAVDLLRNTSGSRQGVVIEIEKRIPLNSGLGGDSSDAAAVLRGLNLLWGLKLSIRDLLNLAAQLGSDVPLFLYGGTLLVEGRGEKVRPLRPMPHMTVVLLIPHFNKLEDKTKTLYSLLNVGNYTVGKITEDFVNMLEGRVTGQQTSMFNVFDNVGLKYFAGLKEYRQKFIEAGAADVHLAGSGPTLFTLLRDDVKASAIHKKLQEKGLEAYLAEF
jgi:4-diphosphocytidyl-2-C-methyl-D-erythritol kinase